MCSKPGSLAAGPFHVFSDAADRGFPADELPARGGKRSMTAELQLRLLEQGDIPQQEFFQRAFVRADYQRIGAWKLAYELVQTLGWSYMAAFHLYCRAPLPLADDEIDFMISFPPPVHREAVDLRAAYKVCTYGALDEMASLRWIFNERCPVIFGGSCHQRRVMHHQTR